MSAIVAVGRECTLATLEMLLRGAARSGETPISYVAFLRYLHHGKAWDYLITVMYLYLNQKPASVMSVKSYNLFGRKKDSPSFEFINYGQDTLLAYSYNSVSYAY